MILNNKDNFWDNHTLDDFQKIAILKRVHKFKITSICFLKDGKIVSASEDNYIKIYNKKTFKTEIKI